MIIKRFLIFLLIPVILISCSGKKKTPRPGDPDADAVIDLNSANRLLGLKRCPEAIAAYRAFLQKHPNDSGAWNLLGLSYLCDRKASEAVEALSRALVISPTFTDVHNNLGVAYMELQDYTKARVEFMAALEDANYPKAGPYFNLAKLAFQQKNYQESRALSKKVITFLPREAGPRLLYAMSLKNLGEAEEAERELRQVLTDLPENIEAAYHLADILLARNEPCEARRYLKQVIDADPLGEMGQNAIRTMNTIRCLE